MLPGGAAIESEWDGVLRLTRRRVLSPRAPAAATKEPEWVGARPGTAVLDKAWHFTPGDELTHSWSNDGGVIHYRFDARKHLLERTTERSSERFAIDANGNYQEVGTGLPGRVYEAGNVLVQRGDTRYLWNDRRQLVEKRRARADGGDDVWIYSWNGQGLLSSVQTPEGKRVELTYDPFARRVRKDVFTADTEGPGERLLSTTRYVWDLESLIHEIVEERAADGTMKRRERCYVYDEFFLQPFAHRDFVGEDRAASEWFYYVRDFMDVPEALVTADGRVACRLERTAFNASTVPGMTDTPIRFVGHYADDETGLWYNRNRYYDPETGRYISPDPLGLLADPNFFRYCPNPITYCDPIGLIIPPHTCTASFTPAGGAPAQGPQGFSTQRPGGGPQLPGFASGWTPHPNHPGRENNPCAQNFMGSHTERSAMNWAQQNFTPQQLNGGNLNLGGDRPPCPSCHNRMVEFSRPPPEGTGCNVNYNWPVGNAVTYSGGNCGNAQGPQGAALVQGYYAGNQRATYQALCQQQNQQAAALCGGNPNDPASCVPGFQAMRAQHAALGFGP